MPERLERNEGEDDVLVATKVYSYLKFVTIFMDLKQRQWLTEAIIFFNQYTDCDHAGVNGYLGGFNVLSDDQLAKIMDCLEDDECRTELVKILSLKEFT